MNINHKNFPISYSEAVAASEQVYRYLTPTPLHHYPNLSDILQADVYVKHENHQPTGSFKIRGGINLLHHLKQDDLAGVITFSTGNHGLSLSQAAKWTRLPTTVVVPVNSNQAKINAIRYTGAKLIEAGKNFDEAAMIVNKLAQEHQLYFAHPANEPHLINGVGSEFIEILQQLPDVDAVILPIGGGSELAAAVTVLKYQKPDIEIYAVQAKASNAAYQSWRNQHITQAENLTFAGGFATGSAYPVTFDIYKEALADFVLLDEQEIYRAIALAGHYTHQYLEGAGASTLMAACKLKQKLKGKKVVIQFSGCNAMPDEVAKAYQLPEFQHGLSSD